MRVLMTGMGGELGTRVAMLLEHERDVEAVVGIDVDPPRRRLRQAVFHRIEPRDRERTAEVMAAFGPTAVLHLGVYEPDARTGPRSSAERTAASAHAVLGAAADLASVTMVVIRSGLEVYGHGKGATRLPDESVDPAPTSGFGRSLLQVEELGLATGARVCQLRMAPVVGPHVPSPLGRYLRLPVVGWAALSDPPFSLLHQDDAARAVVHALMTGADGPFNVVSSGAVRARQAARIGGRLAVPLCGPGWLVARRMADLAGSPVPDHVAELLTKGRRAAGSRARTVLGFEPAFATLDVVRELYEWAPVTHLRVVADDAA